MVNSTTPTYNGRLTSLSHGGGCGCKIAPGILSDILKDSPFKTISQSLLAGSENNEDAAVYQINDRQAIVATTDFFMPICFINLNTVDLFKNGIFLPSVVSLSVYNL